MHESGAGGGGGSAAGQQVPAVADAAGAMDVEEDEQVRRAAEEAQVASGSSGAKIWVTGALMVRGDMPQAQGLAKFLGVSVEWLERRGDSYRGNFQLYELSKHLEEAAAARAIGMASTSTAVAEQQTATVCPGPKFQKMARRWCVSL